MPVQYRFSTGNYNLKPIDFIRESDFILLPIGMLEKKEAKFPKLIISFSPKEKKVFLINNYLKQNKKKELTTYSFNMEVSNKGPKLVIVEHASTEESQIEKPSAKLIID